MKEYLNDLIRNSSGLLSGRLIAREYLQAGILKALQEAGAFTNWAFLGGTALRFLYSLPRFSEDLDFSLKEAGKDSAFIERMEKIKKSFTREGYHVEIKARADKTVQSAFLRFPGLLAELGLSALPAEVLSIKVEIDTNPPAGARFSSTVVRRHHLLNLLHYDKSSLLAGKMHALLTRKYVKGRDLYDLVWYLSDKTWPKPNTVLLQNALVQSKWPGA